MTPFEITVVVLLAWLSVCIVFVGMRIDTKLYFIHDRLGIVLDILKRLEEKLTTIGNHTSETTNAVDYVGKILHHGFEETGRPNGGSNIDPKWKH